MGESDYHSAAIIWLREALEDYFEGSTDVYVASNMLLYTLLAGDRHRRDPDVLVAKGWANINAAPFAPGRRRPFPASSSRFRRRAPGRWTCTTSPGITSVSVSPNISCSIPRPGTSTLPCKAFGW